VLRRDLSCWWHEIVVEDDPLDALRLVDRGDQFDAIVCDLMMPKRGGNELSDAIVRTRPEPGGCGDRGARLPTSRQEAR